MLAAPPLPVVTLIAITMAVNTTATAEITLCRLVSRTVHRAASGTLGMLITWHSPLSSALWMPQRNGYRTADNSHGRGGPHPHSHQP
jgi:hypothetical protein